MMALRGTSERIASRYVLKLLLILVVIATQSTCVRGQITNTFTGTFSIVKAGASSGAAYSSVILGNYSNGETVNILPFNNQDLSLVVNYVCCFTSVVLSYTSSTIPQANFIQTENNPLYALKGNSGSNFFAVPDLKNVGAKQIVVDGYNGSTKISTITLEFSIVQRSQATPTVPVPAPFPVTLPTPVTVPTPVSAPVVTAPIPVPLIAPVPATLPVPAPFVTAPAQAPISAEFCTIPKFVTSAWENYPAKPGTNLAESQGGFIDTDFVIFGGFNGGWGSATNKTYVYNTTNTISGTWSEVDSIPIPKGITHMGHVIVGNKLYGCGGFLGGTGDMASTPECFVYTHSAEPGLKWSKLPNLPWGRAGGALMYDKARNSLTFASGLEFHKPDAPDSNKVWELRLGNLSNGWIPRADMPYVANHVGGTSVLYGADERHYVMGGQKSLQEGNGNYNLVYAYNASSDTWTQRANMVQATGHIGSSTIPYKNCGLFVLGGAVNTGGKTSAVFYYSIGFNNWTNIGSMNDQVNTPVCSTLGDWLYCQSGVAFGPLSYRRKIG